MKKDALRQRLIKENIPAIFYSLDGGLPNEAYCLGFNGDVWEVYYSEKGQKTGLELFTDEESACNYFYDLLTRTLKDMGLL